MVYKQNNIRSLDLSYNYIFIENLYSRYKENFTYLPMNYDSFCCTRFIEEDWLESVFETASSKSIQSIVFYKKKDTTKDKYTISRLD